MGGVEPGDRSTEIELMRGITVTGFCAFALRVSSKSRCSSRISAGVNGETTSFACMMIGGGGSDCCWPLPDGVPCACCAAPAEVSTPSYPWGPLEVDGNAWVWACCGGAITVSRGNPLVAAAVPCPLAVPGWPAEGVPADSHCPCCWDAVATGCVAAASAACCDAEAPAACCAVAEDAAAKANNAAKQIVIFCMTNLTAAW